MVSTVEGLHTVQIENVPRILANGIEKGNEKLFESKSFKEMYLKKYGPFTTGDIKWEVHMYPIGNELKLYLSLLHAVPIKKYGFMNILSNSNNGDWVVGSKTSMNGELDFEFEKKRNALDHSMLRLGNINRDVRKVAGNTNSFTLKLAIWFILDNSHEKFPAPKFTTLLDGKYADIHFHVKGQIFPAHRALLAARSSVFRSEFDALQTNMHQNSMHVSIKHIDELTFKNLLHFIYTNSMPPDLDKAATLKSYHQLFIAAHRFKIENLKIICEKKFTKAERDSILSTLDYLDFQDCNLLEFGAKSIALNHKFAKSIAFNHNMQKK